MSLSRVPSSTSHPRIPFSPPLHPPRPILPNIHQSQSVIHPQALSPNVDIGDSLQDLLDESDDGKQFSLIDPGSNTSPQEIWRSQVIRIYFQNINGLRLADNGSDILDTFCHMETIRADIFGFAETKLDCRSPEI